MYPLYRKLGKSLSLSEWEQKISPPTEFEPWTAQPVVSRYTNYTILAHTRKEITERIVNITKHESGRALYFCIALSRKRDLLGIILLVNLFHEC